MIRKVIEVIHRCITDLDVHKKPDDGLSSKSTDSVIRCIPVEKIGLGFLQRAGYNPRPYEFQLQIQP